MRITREKSEATTILTPGDIEVGEHLGKAGQITDLRHDGPARIHTGLREQTGPGLVAAHELTDFQADFLGAKQELPSARRQLAEAGKAVF